MGETAMDASWCRSFSWFVKIQFRYWRVLSSQWEKWRTLCRADVLYARSSSLSSNRRSVCEAVVVLA